MTEMSLSCFLALKHYISDFANLGIILGIGIFTPRRDENFKISQLGTTEDRIFAILAKKVGEKIKAIKSYHSFTFSAYANFTVF